MTRLASLVRVSSLASLACVALSASTPPHPGPRPCPSGAALGAFDLPVASGGGGSLSGSLVLGSGGAVAFTLTAALVDVPSPCLSCLEGQIQGVLDDGVGVGPDYVVDGTYTGSFFGGSGTFGARVLDLTGTRVVGRIAGEFFDPPPLTGPGMFQGAWRVCP